MAMVYSFGRIVFMVLTLFRVICRGCPAMCKCGTVRSRASETIQLGQRVTCALRDVSSLTDFNLDEMPKDVIYLILRENSLKSIEYEAFASLPGLIRIDLSKNLISEIQEGAFLNLSLVEKLDLSYNKIASLSAGMFESLTSLQRLILQHNSISRLPKSVFDHMSSLRTIDLSSNPLICDCQLKWLIEWARSNGIRISQETACQFPLKLKGLSLSQLSKKDLHCNWPVQLPVFELKPKINQLVFEGDSIVFQCHVSNVEDNTRVVWMFDGSPLTSHSALATVVDTKVSSDHSILQSSLFISKLQPNHSGFWKCHVETSRGNESRSVQIIVVAENNCMCPRTVTVDNKGQYIWPETLASITVEVECAGIPSSNLGYIPAYAYYSCNSEGVWENLDTGACPYISEVTKVLEQFSKTNLSLSKTNVLDSARGLRNYTGDGHALRDKMDIVFIARTIGNYMEFVGHHKEIGEISVDVINTIMGIDRELLHAAQSEDHSCSRLVKCLESLSDALVESTLSRNKNHLAVEEFFAKSEGFHGMTCTSYTHKSSMQERMRLKGWFENFHNDKVLHCNTLNFSSLQGMISKEKNIEAFIQLPPSLFLHPELVAMKNSRHKLQFIIYHNSVLFPSASEFGKSQEVTSSVISSKVALVPIQNLTDPVIVMLQVPVFTSDVRPGWWDFEAAGGQGDWSSEGCFTLQVQGNLVTFSCDRLATYGLLQDLQALSLQLDLQQAQYRLSHPAIYVGSIICFVGIAITVFIYCHGYKKVKMPKKTKHSLINTWISMTMLCLVFSFGVHQTDYIQMCQGVGLILHYLTFCTLLWMIITVSNLYKKLTKREPPEFLSDEPVPDQLLPPKPMLRFYLVGWGVSTIVCGISAAVHLENYGGPNYCFLAFSSSIATFYGPAAILVFFLTIFFLLIYCVLHENTKLTMTGIPLSDSIPIANNVVMELTQTQQEESSLNMDDGKSTKSTEDTEHSYPTQLRAHVTLLLLFLFAWACGAIATGRSFMDHLPADELIFSILYCLFSTLMGSFVFLFYCYSRQDVWHCFIALKQNKTQKSISQEPAGDCHLAYTQDQFTPSMQECQINVTLSQHGSDKAGNCNLLSSHASSTTDHSLNGAEMFYDPRQSVVARKFFEKNRRQQQLKILQKNNLEKEANLCDESKTVKNSHRQSDNTNTTGPCEQSLSSQKQCIDSSILVSNGKTDKKEDTVIEDDLRKKCETFPYERNCTSKLENDTSLTKMHQRNGKANCRDSSSPSNSDVHPSHLTLPPWMVIVPQNCCSNHKDSCTECSDCSRIPPSIISNSCFSDLTPNFVSKSISNKHRPRSRSHGPHSKKNRRQHSWDGRFKNGENKRSRHHSQSQNSSTSRKCCAQTLEPYFYFPRSQSAYEQTAKITIDQPSEGDFEHLQQNSKVHT